MESVDLVQNTYIVAARRFESFDMRNHASIIQWLSRIMENQIHDAADYAKAEKRNRDNEVPIADASGGESTPVAPGSTSPGKSPAHRPTRRKSCIVVRASSWLDCCPRGWISRARRTVLYRTPISIALTRSSTAISARCNSS
jgi:hypothetical protein